MWGDADKKKQEEDAAKKAAEEQSKAQADEMITKMRTAFDEALKPINEKITGFETRFQTIEDATKKPAPKQEPPERISIVDDEEGAFRQHIEPVAAAVIATNARITESEVLNEVIANGWGEYVPKIREIFEKETPLATKASPNYSAYCRNAADLIIGREARNGGLKRNKETNTFFIEGANSTREPGEKASYSQLMNEATDGKIDMLKKSGGDLSVWARKMGLDLDALSKAEA